MEKGITMNFEELWAKVEQLKILPESGIKQIPAILSLRTKKDLCRCSPMETASIIMNAIDQINHGSVETMDALVSKLLK